MEKSIARAKYAGSRRGRRRFSSHARRPTSSSSSVSASSPLANDVWDGYQDVLPLEEIDEEEDNSGKPKSKSQGLDYGEILAQDPFYKYTAPRGLDPLEDAFADLYSFEDSEASSSAAFLSLDLEKLAEHLSGMSLSKRLFLDDETLPSELLRGDETIPPENSEDEETILPENSEAETQEQAATSQSVEDEMEVVEEEEVAVEEWLKVALQDPQDGKAVKFDNDASKEDEAARFKTQDQAEKELESLLNMLDRITVEGNSSSNKAGEDVEAVTNLEAPVMSQKDLESLFWSPESPKSADRPHRKVVSSPDRSKKEEETKNLPPSDEDDFDAWLDSLDK